MREDESNGWKGESTRSGETAINGCMTLLLLTRQLLGRGTPFAGNS